MKHGLTLVVFALAMLSTACEGVIMLGDLVSGTDAGSDVIASDAGQDVIANDVQADADAQAEVEAGSKTLLTISFNGPVASELYPGQKAAPFLNALFCAAEELVFQELNYVFGAGIDTLFDHFPYGAPYFTNIRVVDMDNGNVVMGPKELLTYVDLGQVIPFNDTFTMNKGECRSLSLVADVAHTISQCPSCVYQAQLWIPANNLGLVTSQGKPLTSDQIIPTTNIVGNLMTVGGYVDAGSDAQEKFAAYCDPLSWDPQNAYMGCCGEFNKVSPSELKAGDLIKAEGYHTVYFYGSDGKRYVFPTSVEMDSWFSPLDTMSVPLHDFNPNCQKVLEITEAELAAIPLGSNVTKRPGAYITGITTDPKRYVVDTHHVLREASPQILEQIYPYQGEVQTRTYLTADAFFGNYTLGTPLTSADEYIWLQKYPGADLEVELGIKP